MAIAVTHCYLLTCLYVGATEYIAYSWARRIPMLFHWDSSSKDILYILNPL